MTSRDRDWSSPGRSGLVVGVGLAVLVGTWWLSDSTAPTALVVAGTLAAFLLMVGGCALMVVGLWRRLVAAHRAAQRRG